MRYVIFYEVFISKTIFVTEETFGKEYNEIAGDLYFKDTHVNEIFYLGKSLLEVDVKKRMPVNSLNVTDKYRARIVQHCKSAKSKQTLIVYGKDTMGYTVKVLASQNISKIIVLTGAIIHISLELAMVFSI